ncbi:lisH domain-containing protein C1711.05-like [Limulus polyphemus]|uniref:LisH domain-containing protein C1711.05-like n=1 Tax=Limulus polyphemus TaxID=6850 RepID=A0ABM1C2A9_LIMPO|nr:lisH domain-containing protein C1711.05-like [Limulus polyphemus]
MNVFISLSCLSLLFPCGQLASGTGANKTVYGTNPNHVEETTTGNKKVVSNTATENGGEGSDDPLSTSGVNRRTAILFKKKTVGSRRGGSHGSGLKRMGARTRRSTDKSDHMSSLTSTSSPVPAFLDSAAAVTNVFTMTAASLVPAVKDRPAKRRSRSASQTTEPVSPKQKPAAAPLTSLGAFPSSPLPQTDSFKIYRSTSQDQGSDTDHQSETSSDTSDSSSSSDSQSESESDVGEGGESQGGTTGDDDTSTLSEPRKGLGGCRRGISSQQIYNLSIDVKTVFKPSHKINTLLLNQKESLPKEQKHGIFSISCEFGKKYTGQTSHSLEMRCKAHKGHIRRGEFQISTLTCHQFETSHKILCDEVLFLHQPKTKMERDWLETIEIIKANDLLLNHDNGPSNISRIRQSLFAARTLDLYPVTF